MGSFWRYSGSFRKSLDHTKFKETCNFWASSFFGREWGEGHFLESLFSASVFAPTHWKGVRMLFRLSSYHPYLKIHPRWLFSKLAKQKTKKTAFLHFARILFHWLFLLSPPRENSMCGENEVKSFLQCSFRAYLDSELLNSKNWAMFFSVNNYLFSWNGGSWHTKLLRKKWNCGHWSFYRVWLVWLV